MLKHRRAIPPETTAGETPALALRMPFRRDVLGFEFVPPLDFPRSAAHTGQPFTTVGTPPTLTDGEPALDMDPTSGLIFPVSVQELLNADPSGFTVVFVMPGKATPSGAVLSVLNVFDDPAIDNSPFGVYVDDATLPNNNVHVMPYVFHSDSEGESASNFTTPPSLNATQRVFAVRFERDRPIQSIAVSAVDYEATRNRLSHFNESGELAVDGTGPDPESEDADVQAGTILQLPIVGTPLNPGGFAVGSVDGSGDYVSYPRLGAVWIFTEALTNVEIVEIIDWVHDTHVVSYPT